MKTTWFSVKYENMKSVQTLVWPHITNTTISIPLVNFSLIYPIYIYIELNPLGFVYIASALSHPVVKISDVDMYYTFVLYYIITNIVTCVSKVDSIN